MHSNQITIIIIDDEEHIRDLLRRKVKECSPIFKVVAEADSVREGIEIVEHLKPEIVLLDMALGDSTGIEFLQHTFRYKSFQTIVVTSYGSEYAVQTHNCKQKPFYFLQKPIDGDELRDQVLLPLINKIRIDDRYMPSEILYIYFDSKVRSASFVLANGHKVVAKNDTLSSYKSILDNFDFFQIHESHWVNFEHILGVRAQNKEGEEQRGGYTLMRNHEFLKISNHRRKEFNDAWTVFQKRK
jgi:two-component system LytT family response regulator